MERRAFRQAQFALRDNEAALDVVQDAMMRLAEKYAHKPVAELPLLFQRILQNAVHDHHRRSRVRNLWVSLFSALGNRHDADHDSSDGIEPCDTQASEAGTPQEEFEQIQTLAIIEEEIGRLPPRQREAFLMRYWEEMNIAETASAMGCTEGSVKTHCSRATHTLAAALRARGISL